MTTTGTLPTVSRRSMEAREGILPFLVNEDAMDEQAREARAYAKNIRSCLQKFKKTQHLMDQLLNSYLASAEALEKLLSYPGAESHAKHLSSYSSIQMMKLRNGGVIDKVSSALRREVVQTLEEIERYAEAVGREHKAHRDSKDRLAKERQSFLRKTDELKVKQREVEMSQKARYFEECYTNFASFRHRMAVPIQETYFTKNAEMALALSRALLPMSISETMEGMSTSVPATGDRTHTDGLTASQIGRPDTVFSDDNEASDAGEDWPADE